MADRGIIVARRASVAGSLCAGMLVAAGGCAEPDGQARRGVDSGPLDPCEWCGAQDAPADPPVGVMTIAGEDEPGDRIVLRGRVFGADSVTPVPGVLVYAYHTDATGVYPRDGDETGNARRHGELRGWALSDELGRYEIRTIRPAPYPSRSEPAHVHVTLTYPGQDEDWIESTLFEGDGLLSAGVIETDREDGRFGAVVRLERRDDGVWVGERDLRPRGSRP